MTEENPTPAPAPEPTTPSSTSSDKATRYAAYDKTLAKFVGGVHDTKAKAKAAAKGVDDVEIREV